MKLFKVWVDKYSLDDYDSFVCLANDAEEAKRLIPGGYGIRLEDGIHLTYSDGRIDKDLAPSYIGWPHDLNEINVEAIDVSSFKEPTVLLASYNAG